MQRLRISELHQACLDLGLVLGDPIELSYPKGGRGHGIFREVNFSEGEYPPRTQFSKFRYVTLSGLTSFEGGSGRDGNFDFLTDYSGIARWEPSSQSDLEKIALIQNDLRNGTSHYIK